MESPGDVPSTFFCLAFRKFPLYFVEQHMQMSRVPKLKKHTMQGFPQTPHSSHTPGCLSHRYCCLLQPALLAATSAKNAYEFEAAPHARWKSCSLIVLIATFAIHLAACSLFAMCSSAKLELSQGKYATAEVPPEASPSRPTHVPCGTQRTCSRVHITLNLMRLETA